jgi:hypothetical protein
MVINQQFFMNIIEKWLDKRESDPDSLYDDGGYKIQKYLVGMFLEIQLFIPNSTFDDIARLDRIASGHIDYHSKFGLYCFELYKEKAQ